MTPTLPIPLDADTRLILGMTCVDAGVYVRHLRKIGHPVFVDVPTKAEAEQAAFIHWLLNLYLLHGPDWRKVASPAIEGSKVGEAPLADIVFRSDCHPQANGRQPVSGDVGEEVFLTLESGQKLRLFMGKKGFANFASVILERMADDAMREDADEPGEAVTFTHPDTTRLNAIEKGHIEIHRQPGIWTVQQQGFNSRKRSSGSTLREAIDKHLQ